MRFPSVRHLSAAFTCGGAAFAFCVRNSAGVTITLTFDRVASPAEVAAALEAAAAQARIER